MEDGIVSERQLSLRPFGLRDKVGYMFGDFGNDFTFLLSSGFLLKFYTDVMGVSASLVGLMMMLARIVDAFTDVAMGLICDRSPSTAKGKFTPWLRRMCGPVAVASLLMYASWFQNMSMGFKIFWMFFSYLLWGSVFYTSINIPYGSMASAISAEAKDRTALSSWRTIGATLAGTAMGVVVPLVVYYKNKEGHTLLSGEQMTLAALGCSVAAVLCYLICYSLTTERVKIDRVSEPFSLTKLVKALFSNRSLIGIVVASIMLLMSFLTVNSMNQYLYINYFNSNTALATATLITSVVTILEAFLLPFAAARYGKKELAVGGALLGIAVMALAFFLRTEQVQVWIALSLVLNVGIGTFNICCWAMITDVIDDVEVRSGKRLDGTVYATYSFARKLGQAVSAGISGALLTMIGYSKETAFSEPVRRGIYNISTLVPIAGLVLMCLALIFIYPLNKKRVDANVAFLKAKREEKEGK